MIAHAAPALYTAFIWWFCTGAILFLNKQPRALHGRSMWMASVIVAAALFGLSVTRNDTTVFGAYAGFTCSVMVWGWQEMAFLMGYVTGPLREDCPPGLVGARRFLAATRAVIYHELALAATLVAILAITWKSPNQVGLWTFAVLWIMRLSAKLNLFLGVRNRSEDFLPDHLRYLQTFFSKKSVNLLFPLSVAASSVAAVLGWTAVFKTDLGSVEAVRLIFACALLTLAILEHWLMVLPLDASRLWAWAHQRQLVPAHAPRTSGPHIASERDRAPVQHHF